MSSRTGNYGTIPWNSKNISYIKQKGKVVKLYIAPLPQNFILNFFDLGYQGTTRCCWVYTTSVLARVSIPAQTSWPRSSWGGKGLFSLHFHIAVHHWKKSELELKQAGQGAGADAEAMEGCSLLACSACSLIEPRLPAQSWSHPQGAFPPWSLIEKMPDSCISWRHFLNWSSFLCDNSSCVKLTQN